MTGLMHELFSAPAWLVLVVVLAIPALESSAFLGFVFPGETAVLLGGVVASQGRVPVLAVFAAAVGGAVAGDAVGYVVGRRWGRRILDSTLGRFVKQEHLDRAERSLRRRGGTSVFVGRFTVALRVLVPGLAGMSAIPYRRFAVFNVAGALVWGGVMVTAGYVAGSNWQSVERLMSRAGLAVTAVVVAVLLVVHVVRRRRRGRSQVDHTAAEDSRASSPALR